MQGSANLSLRKSSKYSSQVSKKSIAPLDVRGYCRICGSFLCVSPLVCHDVLSVYCKGSAIRKNALYMVTLPRFEFMKHHQVLLRL